jgi:hypothetical protein
VIDRTQDVRVVADDEVDAGVEQEVSAIDDSRRWLELEIDAPVVTGDDVVGARPLGELDVLENK